MMCRNVEEGPTTVTAPLPLDVIIFGGGAAGLWLLDELTRSGLSPLLLEAHDLGSGQTIASQGIIHGGLKYTLGGLLTLSAQAIAQMPLIWRRCLAGEAKPDLRSVRLRAEYCHLWQTTSLRSRLAMIGARTGLRVAPVKLEAHERPPALANCPGVVARLDEQVIDVHSFIAELSDQHARRIIKIDAAHGLEFSCSTPAKIDLVRLINPETGDPIDLRPNTVIFTAGAGNATLRKLAKLSEDAMQRRPLHMVMIRGGNDLPLLNGHCVDGTTTRVTITSTRDFDDRVVWQIGGQIAERGVAMDEQLLIAFAQKELKSVLPRANLDNAEWATYRVDRAEGATRGGTRPDEPQMKIEGNTITAWPTKLALVPELVRRIKEKIQNPNGQSLKGNALNPAPSNLDFGLFTSWPRPVVALPPWEMQEKWQHNA